MDKDSITIGVIGGIIGNIPKVVTTWILYMLGWINYTFIHIGAGYFLEEKFISNSFALIVGIFSDFIVASTLGLIIVFIIRQTGKDYSILKGIVVGSLSYLIIYGVFMTLNLSSAVIKTPLPTFLLIFPHIFLGGTAGWFIGRYYELPEEI